VNNRASLGALATVAPRVRVIVAAVAAFAASGLLLALWLISSGGAEPQTMTATQAAALARLAPYAELLAEDFDAGVAALPADFGRIVDIAGDGLSASGLIALEADGDRCAAIRLEIGPGYLIDGDPAGIEVSGPVLLDGAQCPPSPAAAAGS
jgi:hypothetical protein